MHLIGSKSDLINMWKMRLSTLKATLNQGLENFRTIEHIKVEVRTLEKCILELESLRENKKEFAEKGALCAKR